LLKFFVDVSYDQLQTFSTFDSNHCCLTSPGDCYVLICAGQISTFGSGCSSSVGRSCQCSVKPASLH